MTTTRETFTALTVEIVADGHDSAVLQAGSASRIADVVVLPNLYRVLACTYLIRGESFGLSLTW